MDKTEYNNGSAFSGSRFMTLLKSDFRINGNSYLKLTLAAFGCFVAAAVLVSISAIGNIHSLVEGNAGKMAEQILEGIINTQRQSSAAFILMWGIFIYAIGMTVFGSLTFSSMGNKKGRISTFMLPASLCEKFLLRTLVYFVFGNLVLAVGFLIAVGIAQLSFEGGGKVWLLCEDFFNETGAWYVFVIVSLFMIMDNAVYTLGSALWPKLSWLKTWIVLTILQWILGILLITGIFSNMSWFYNLGKSLASEEVIVWGIIAFQCVIIVLCWVFAWIRFKNTQIVQMFMKK